MTNLPLVIAAHGTRDKLGVETCHQLVARIRTQLTNTCVEAGFVELNTPNVEDAIVQVLSKRDDPRCVVVPLMLGDGGHVRRDIPDAIATAKTRIPDAKIAYGGYLGQDPRLVQNLVERTKSACGKWAGESVAVVVVGRGTLVPEANSDHCRLTRLVAEHTGLRAEPAFIQVVQPDLPTTLQRLYASGARRIVVVPNYLFPGRLLTWVHEQSDAWAQGCDAEIRYGQVIGDCDELASVVVDRYRAAALTLSDCAGSPTYLSGLKLSGRAVLVVGGGAVNARRVPDLVNAGALVTLISPAIDAKLQSLANAGRLTWLAREWVAEDLPLGADAPWYVLAGTDSPEVNRQIAERAEAAHSFCVRADQADGGSAWTPAVNHVGDCTFALVGAGDPRLIKRARETLAKALAQTIVTDAG